MSDADWEQSGTEQPKKKGIPKWLLWGCGIGCLGTIVLVAVATVVGVGFVQDAMDPEKQWPKIEKVLPFDERPAHLELQAGIPLPGISQFIMHDTKLNAIATLRVLGGAQAGSYDQFFSASGGGFAGMGSAIDPEPGTLEIQGREVRTLRFSRISPQPGSSIGPGIRIDLSEEGNDYVMVELQSMGHENVLTDEDIQSFFEPFDVWRGR